MPSDRRPVALLLTPVWPAPGGSGRAMRAWDWLQELAREHRVHVLVDGAAAQSEQQDGPASGHWAVPSVRASRRQRLPALAFAPLCLADHSLALDWPQWDLAEVITRLKARLNGQPVARVVVFRLYLHDAAMQIARQFPEAELELDMDDLESTTRWSVAGSLWRMRRPLSALRSAAGAVQYGLLERFVRGPYRRAWLASKDDCARLGTRLAPVVGSRPNRLASVPGIAPPPEGRLRLLFVGTLDYPPNEEAVRMLVLRVLPVLRQRLSAPWSLCVVGRHAPAQLAALLQCTPEVEFVPDALEVTPWYEASHVVLVPLRAGGGTKFKSLEGFAHRRPIVSTLHGMRGLGAKADEHYLPAETPHEFAQAIIRLAGDCALSERLATAGWELFHQGGSCA